MENQKLIEYSKIKDKNKLSVQGNVLNNLQQLQNQQNNSFFTMTVGGHSFQQSSTAQNTSNIHYNKQKSGEAFSNGQNTHINKERVPLVTNVNQNLIASNGAALLTSNEQLQKQILSNQISSQNKDMNDGEKNKGENKSHQGTTNGTKSTSTLGSTANLMQRDSAMSQATNGSQIILVRGSMNNGQVMMQSSAANSQTTTLQNNNATNRVSVGMSQQQNVLLNAQYNTQQQLLQQKGAKVMKNERIVYSDKKQQSQLQQSQAGLFPRISNLRNEVTVLFKNSAGAAIQGQASNGIPTSTNSSHAQVAMLQSDQFAPAQQQIILNNNGTSGTGSSLAFNRYYNTEQSCMSQTQTSKIKQIFSGAENLMSPSCGLEFQNEMIIQNLPSNGTQKSFVEGENQNSQQQSLQNQIVMRSPNGKTETDYQTYEDPQSNNSKQKTLLQYNNKHYNTEKPGSLKHQQMLEYQQKVAKDDTNIGLNNYQKVQGANNGIEDPSNLILTPQMLSANNNKRQHSQQQKSFSRGNFNSHGMVNGSQVQNPNQQQQQQFFSRRAGSQKETVIINNQVINDQQNNSISTGAGVISGSSQIANQLSPLNSTQFKQQLNYESMPQMAGSKKNQLAQFEDNNSKQDGQINTVVVQQSQFQEQQQIKIPVICGFHKRVLLLTSQVGQQGGPNGTNAQNQQQQRRVRNKNPNCNHNSNFVFYQPSYNNVKYDDSYKKKEEVLRKVFFKECVKEEEKRNIQSNQHAAPKISEPIVHLKIIEDYLQLQLFMDYEAMQQGAQPVMLQNMNQNLLSELSLDTAIIAHKAFLLALIKAGKIVNENMFKVLHEFKASSKEFDQECIYCKYSQYALRESAKTQFVISTQIDTTGGAVEQYNEPDSDHRVTNLVRMFQSQLFKRSFINTSLMIIQKKMNEKLIKQKTQQGQNDKDGISRVADNKKKLIVNGKDSSTGVGGANKKGPVNQSLTGNAGVVVTTLDQIASQMQKLGKNLANPKDKEKYFELKEKYYREFLQKIITSNNATTIFPKASFAAYKYYVGRGNNSQLVKNCLKQRFWWSLGDFDDWESYNFIWTQWKNNKILGCIKSNADVIANAQNELKNSTNGNSDSMLSTQVTSITDKESLTSSVETLLATPTRQKRASTLPHSIQNGTVSSSQQQNGSSIKKTSSITNSASKNIKLQQTTSEDPKDKSQTSHSVITYGHLENNFHLSNKKALYYNMKIYYESIGQDWFRVLPLTFHIKEGVNDKEFAKFTEVFKGNDYDQYGSLDKLGKQIWIVKPGENTNRGCGIQVCRELQQIQDIVKNTSVNGGQKRSYIIQKYIEKPLLYKQRKFDIRCFALVTSVNGNLQAYWYNEGYLRTSSKEFSLKNVTNRLIHLTNDAVQKKSDDYGKFENGNKLSYQDFQKYLDSQDIKCNIVKDIVPQMKKITTDTIKAVSRKIDPHRRHCSFEIFGYDFMINEDLVPWLIEVNTNPCLELSAPYLARLIPTMVENAVKIAVDPLFPPPPWPNSKKHLIPDCQDNKFELVFNENVDAQELKNLPIDDTMNGIIEEEEMEDEGSDGAAEEDDGGQ